MMKPARVNRLLYVITGPEIEDHRDRHAARDLRAASCAYH